MSLQLLINVHFSALLRERFETDVSDPASDFEAGAFSDISLKYAYRLVIVFPPYLETHTVSSFSPTI